MTRLAHRSRGTRRLRHKSTSRSRVPGVARRRNTTPVPTEESRSSPGGRQDLRQQVASSPRFPIVGIGASAGGLEAFTQLLRALPNDTGMAFVFVQHLDPTHETVLTDLLSKATRMPTNQVEDGTPVQPDHVYVIPPNHSLTISDGILRLGRRDKTHGRHLPIDTFLASLADDQGARAIGVILSGTGTDGAIGLRAITSTGGVTFAQDERSAPHAGMPHSAVVAGAVDLVLPAREIAAELARIARHPYVDSPATTHGDADHAPGPDGLRQIFLILRSATGTDFQGYKPATVRRRVARRMLLQRIETFESYARHLRRHPAEVQALHDDLFVTVTRFFRDADVFHALARTVFSGMMKDRPRGTPIRIWTPGCATGEEAYSILIALTEFLETAKSGGDDVAIQLFATDANAASIARARAGRYPESIALDVSPERLRRFFVKVDGQYQVTKSLRDMTVFAVHNVGTDPPFSRLDLLTCRNVLIYLGPDLQKRVLPVFHYALKATGFLLLGNAETPGTFSDLFVPVDKVHRIYARRPGPPRAALGWRRREPGGSAQRVRHATAERVPTPPEPELGREADRILLTKYAPAGVIVNDDLEVLHVRGRTGPYLELPSGAASFNLLKLLREGLLVDVRAAVKRARTTGALVRKDGAQVRRNGGLVRVNIAVIPLRASTARGATPGAFLVLFEDSPSPTVSASQRKGAGRMKRRGGQRTTEALRAELESTKEYLQAIINEREAANEELKSASEELQSTNEELQSTNEELETSKEELQSVNEELGTVNDELQARNAELGRLNSDLANILSSVTIPIIIVGPDLRIRRFTGMANRVLNVVPTDVGRSILDIRWKIELEDVERVLLGVIETLTPWEHDVQDQDGHWYSVRALPYRSIDDKIDGAVIAFIDVDARRQLENEIQKRADGFERVSTMKDEFLALLSHELRTPMSAMLGWARLLRSGKLDRERSAHAVEIIERSMVLQARLVEDMLDVSRIVAGKLRVERRPIALRDVAEAAVEALRPAAGAKRVQLASALGSDPAHVVGDSIRLQQAIGNLLSNALKFTPEGGTIEVRLGRTESHVQLQVRDTGEGIAADLLPHLFERFRQGEGSIIRPHAGLGLGLALTRYLVEQHEGTIRAESPGPRKGATFTVRLPAAPLGTEVATAERGRAERLVAPPSLAGIRVLVVEDHDDTREFLAAVLGQCGAEVTTATSARSAVAAFERAQPHVLVSDIAMPGEHGYSLIQTVRALAPEHGGRVPALALTAYVRPEDRERALAAGYNQHLAKPVDPLDLAGAVALLADRA
jgi:two-component system, chemotaxis family, CheB/CheR fusion protein